MKNMGIKRAVALTLLGAMGMSTLSGCGAKTASTDAGKEVTQTTDKKTETGGTTATETATSTEGYKDYSKGFENNVTIQIPVYDRAFEGWNVTNNYWTNWIQSEFGDKYNVTVEYVAIGRSTEVNDYNQMLAAGTAPDIIFHYDMPQAVSYYTQGAMQPIDLEEMKFYAPDYYEMTADMSSTYGQMDGETYFFFAERPTAYNWVTLVRKDWMDKTGKGMPANLNEFNDMLKAWKDAGLGNGGGSLIQNNFTYDYAFRDWPINQEERTLYSDLSVAALTWAPSKDFLKNMNYQYNNGLIDPEFYLKTEDAQIKADFVAGKTGMYSLYLTSNTDVIASLKANNPEAEIAVLAPEAAVPEGKKPQARAYWPFGMIMGVNSTTSEEERAALWMFLDWMMQEDHLFSLQNGVEGQNYTLSTDGLPVKVEGFSGESALSQNNNKDYWCLWSESVQYGSDDLNYKANLANWAPAGYEYLIEDAYKNFKATEEYYTPDALFTVTLEKQAEYKTDLNELWKQLYVQCVLAPEAQFDATYEKACTEYLDAGYAQILEEKKEQIAAGNYK